MEQTVEIPVIDNSVQRKELINRIESTVLKILKDVSEGRMPEVSYLSVNCDISLRIDAIDEGEDTNPSSKADAGCSSNAITEDNPTSESKEMISSVEKMININFSPKINQLKLTRLMIILAKAHRLLLTGEIQTKRSLYYELKGSESADLFPNPEIVNSSIILAASFLQCTTWDLGFIATSKGLVAGDLFLKFANGDKINCNTPGGVLVPQMMFSRDEQIVLIKSSATCIIIVEKEAVFRKLLEEDCARKLNAILVTGKGYPDTATRLFIKLLADKLHLPPYIIVDANPFGFDIMCTYKFGSAALWWEHEQLSCPAVQWIGVYPSDLLGLNVPTIPLSTFDVKRLDALEKRCYLTEEQKSEMKLMRRYGKAEIESVAAISPRFLSSSYLPTKIQYFRRLVQGFH